ncbi:Nn.00g101090.m01.CDS01 [Neocucurbitaria sp. VM-36]
MALEVNLGTVLVTDGAGFLGSHIIKRLLEGSHATTIIGASPNLKANSYHADPKLIHHARDITSPSSVDDLFQTLKPIV